ncbi:ABC transporter ATP-binding protein/permease [Brytella acorum]|uniref:ATP-binding cassette domain-containing protein n=1 Tax=Brytella acorum TaxID=2959299 RepID=A0AA35XXR9_9PROT|nr:ATP-binding cassette domain-containing protein [Brytella acorum]CAI9122263.1 ATP-binding cassette domain-containing protein [Brytella acorum]
MTEFWFSRHGILRRYLLLIGAIIATQISVYGSLLFTRWQGALAQLLVSADSNNFGSFVLAFVIAVCTTEVSSALALLFIKWIGIDWRQWLTNVVMRNWLRNDAFAWMERTRRIDNPDQRISEDTDQFATTLLSLAIGFLKNISMLWTYSLLVWEKGGPLVLGWGGQTLTIQGGMFWFSIAWASFVTIVAAFAGRAFKTLTIRQQQAEANFRFAAADIRNNAEAIALMHGGPREGETLLRKFLSVRTAVLRLAFFNARFDMLRGVLAMIGAQIPTLLLLPRYFRHEIGANALMQTAAGVAALTVSLQWIVDNYTTIQQFRAASTRLTELKDAAAEAGRLHRPAIERAADSEFILHDLSVADPENKTLIGNLSATIRPGERWIVRGSPGSGKSSLLRTLGGLWPYGNGTILFPHDANVISLPQLAYFPDGTLRDALAYPQESSHFKDADYAAALSAALMTPFSSALDETARWRKRLSPGQLQKLAFARAFLHKPDILFLDEATASLDGRSEEVLYRTLVAHLPASIIVSVSHHPSLDRFHTDSLDLAGDGAWTFGKITL